ncbi:MAG: cytochrome P450 [Thaumarchaeota archaeon]|nr:cytochrome P450 [Nitrososphaerota archaeon]
MQTELSAAQLKEIPGGFMFRFGRNPFDLFRNAAKKYGDICYISGGRASIYLVNNPEYIHDILVANHKDFGKRSPLKFLGNGLITSNGDYHHRQKRLIQPAFHQEKIATYAKVMTDYTQRLMVEWNEGQVVNMEEQMMRLTLEIVAKCLFGTDIEYAWKEFRNAASTIVNHLDKRTGPMGLLIDRLPFPTNKRYEKAVQKLDEIVYRIIRERRKNENSISDLLTMLLQARSEDGSAMSDTQIRDETITLLFAGHETTANALTWTWYLLAGNPTVEAKLHSELDNLFPKGRLPSAEDVPKLSYTTKIFTEALRMYPSVRLIPRIALNDHHIDGYRIPAGSLVLMSQYLIHHDQRFYSEPEVFNPDRWTDEFEQKMPEYAYFPFGGGPRRCAGEPFAWMEAELIISTIARNWKMSLVPGGKYELRSRVGSRPKYGMMLKLSKR